MSQRTFNFCLIHLLLKYRSSTVENVPSLHDSIRPAQEEHRWSAQAPSGACDGFCGGGGGDDGAGGDVLRPDLGAPVPGSQEVLVVHGVPLQGVHRPVVTVVHLNRGEIEG